MKKGIRVRCDRQKIFQFVTDYRNVNFLLEDFLHFEPEFSGPIQSGCFYTATGNFAIVKFAIPFLVTHYIPDSLMVLEAQEQLHSRVVWEVQAGENGQPLLCLQVDLDLNTANSPVLRPLLSIASWISGPIKAQIRHKQQSLVTNALLKAKRSLEAVPEKAVSRPLVMSD